MEEESAWNTSLSPDNIVGRIGQRTYDLRLTPLKSGLAAQETGGHNDGTSPSSVRVRAVDSARSPKHIAEVTLYFSWQVPKNRSSNKFLVTPLFLLVYYKIRRLSTYLCAFPPAAYVLTDLEAGEFSRFLVKSSLPTKNLNSSINFVI